MDSDHHPIEVSKKGGRIRGSRKRERRRRD